MPAPARTSLAAEQIPRPVRSVLVRVRDLLFETDERLLSPPARLGYFFLRLGWLVVRAFFRDRLQIRAASLSFTTMLAVVPALALTFAVARATGLYATFRSETIDPFLDEILSPEVAERSAGVAALRGAAEGVLLLVDQTRLTGLGVAGVVVLVIALLRVVRGIEEAFRHIFPHRGPPKAFHRRARALAIAMLVTPLGLLYSVTTASLTHGTRTMIFLTEVIPHAPLRGALLFLLPPFITTLAIYVLYVELPQGKVSHRSALFGAVFAALGWYGLQLLHVRLQVGLARWNAIYSGFGALPVLLASIQASWVMVLIGGQLAAARESAPTLRLLSRGAPTGHRAKQHIAIRIVTELSRHTTPQAGRALATALATDLRLILDILDALEVHLLVVRSTSREGAAWALAREPSSVRAGDVLEALEAAAPGELPWSDHDPGIEGLLRGRRAAADASGHNLTIAELAGRGRLDAPAPDASDLNAGQTDAVAADARSASDTTPG